MIEIRNVVSLDSAMADMVDFCTENVREKIDIIVPDKLSLFAERYLLEKTGLEASFDIKVSTLNRYAKQRLAVDKTNQITNTGSIILVHKILNEHMLEFNVVKNKAYSFSYAEEIYKTIAQLKASKITFGELLDFKHKNAQLTDKIHDLGLCYKYYEDGKAGLLDASDMFLMSAFSIADGKENRKIVFLGFDDFTAIEYSLIERLAVTTEVYVYNYYSENKNKFIYNNEMYSQLKNIAYKNQIGLKIQNIEKKSSKLKEFLGKNLFSLEKNKFCLEKETVKIFSSSNMAGELEFVARDIRDKILRGGNYSDFGVAVYGLDGVATKVKEIFSKYEINYYLDTNFTLNKSVFYKFLLSVFKYNLDGDNLPHLIDIINSPFYQIDEKIKNKFIEKLIIFKCRGEFKGNYDFGADFKEEQQKLKAFLKLFKFEKDMSINEIIVRLENADKVIDFERILTMLSNNSVALQDKILLQKSKELVFNLFDEIKTFYPEANLNAVYDIFSQLSSSLKINNLPLNLDAVKIVEATNCVEEFEFLYIVNCTSENAPSLKFDCGIILDEEIEKLNFSNKLSPTIAHINSLARLRLFNLCLLFNRGLTLTYSKKPSDVVREMCEKIDVKIGEEIYPLAPLMETKLGTYTALSKWDYLEFLSKNFKDNEKLTEIFGKNNEISQLSEKSLKIYENIDHVSASFLENYFKCPFYAFLNNTLKIQPRLDSEIQSLDVGNILHEILFKYYTKNKQVGDIFDFCKSEVFNYAEKIDRLKMNKNSPILSNLVEEAVRVINGVDYIDSKSAFKPRDFEHGFSDAKLIDFGDVNLVGKVDRIDEFDGMLRIVDYKSGSLGSGAEPAFRDVYYGYKLQLFLYACAMENEMKKPVVGGFYLPLHNNFERGDGNPYILKGFFENEEKVVDALDVELKSGEKSDVVNLTKTKDGLARRSGKAVTPSEFNAVKKYSLLVSNKAITEIFSGFIEPTPSELSKQCEYCPYVHICLRKTNAIEGRKVKDVKIDSFLGDAHDAK